MNNYIHVYMDRVEKFTVQEKQLGTADGGTVVEELCYESEGR
jgi:hypothetical protein